MIARFVEVAGMTPPLKDVPVDQAKLNPLFVQSLTIPAEVAETPDFFLPAKCSQTSSEFPRKHLHLELRPKRFSLT